MVTTIALCAVGALIVSLATLRRRELAAVVAAE
jgi:hypothetical protein